MPDMMIASHEIAAPPSGAGILSDYRSSSIGQLVVARAKAAGEIRRIVKDKKAEIPSKTGGRSYSYAYADLASVMDAVDDALAAQELALFQTMTDRRGAVFLVTTLAHSSDQWISSEIRVSGLDAGPQVFGSALTYMRRYSALSILGLAPDADDDGRAAQDRADQQARQRPAQATQQPPGESGEPQHMPIQTGESGLLVGRWTRAALELLDGKSEAWRRAWLELHEQEIDDVRAVRPDYADKVNFAAIAPDLTREVAP